ncbi:MAG TPA: SigE family RNA polymerase sigma factor [Streptosporangiaceae bacterium]|nr:SigE family RNA polymerase sigma factor [Streptosporangiaceae bacterium]
MRSADDADFSTFVAASARRLLRSAYLITGSLPEAEDLLQTALEKAYRRWPSIRQKDIPEAYVRKVLVTAAIDAGRRRKPASAPLDEDILPGAPDPAVEGVPGRAALLSCVRELPAGQRAVLVLRYFDDLTEADTARMLGCSVGTVKSQHARAMARLRELVANQPDGSMT